VSGGSTVVLRMRALPENVALARLALSGVAAIAGASQEELADLKLAVSEICTNAVVHAYGPNGTGSVVIRYTVGDAAVTVAVEDTGVGFDPSSVEEPVLAGVPDADRVGSLGLHIARSVTDELRVESGDAGSVVVFTKQLAV